MLGGAETFLKGMIMTEPEAKRRKLDDGRSTRDLNTANVRDILLETDSDCDLAGDILQIPYDKLEDVFPYLIHHEDTLEAEEKAVDMMTNYWLLRCPNASWRWLIWQFDMFDQCNVATTIHSHAEELTDPSLSVHNVCGVLSSVKKIGVLENCLGVPPSKVKELRQQGSIEEQYREGLITYWLNYSPFATWEWLAGRLYWKEEEKALKAVKPFLCDTSEPSFTIENLQEVIEKTPNWFRTRYRIRRVFQAPESQFDKTVTELALSSTSSHQLALAMAKLFVECHPTPSWKLVAQALYSEGLWEAAEIVHTKYLKPITLQELCIEAIATFVSSSQEVESLPLPRPLQCKLTQLIDTYPFIKLSSCK